MRLFNGEPSPEKVQHEASREMAKMKAYFAPEQPSELPQPPTREQQEALQFLARASKVGMGDPSTIPDIHE